MKGINGGGVTARQKKAPTTSAAEATKIFSKGIVTSLSIHANTADLVSLSVLLIVSLSLVSCGEVFA